MRRLLVAAGAVALSVGTLALALAGARFGLAHLWRLPPGGLPAAALLVNLVSMAFLLVMLARRRRQRNTGR